jgi:hypothetical protein
MIKKNTSGTGKWIAEFARMWPSSPVSLATHRSAKDHSQAATRIRVKLLQGLIDA